MCNGYIEKAMDKLTPITDGMGLEDKIHSNMGKGKELIAVHPPSSGCGSNAEGSAIGNFGV